MTGVLIKRLNLVVDRLAERKDQAKTQKNTIYNQGMTKATRSQEKGMELILL